MSYSTIESWALCAGITILAISSLVSVDGLLPCSDCCAVAGPLVCLIVCVPTKRRRLV